MQGTMKKALGSTLCAAALMAGGTAAADTIEIGVIANLTGNDVTSSLSLVRGIEIGVAEINAAGGINGDMIELIVEDSEYRTQEALSSATKLYDADGVQAVIMFGGSSLMLPVAELAQQKGRILINAASSSPKLGEYPGTLFSILPLDDIVGNQLGDWIASRDVSSVALVAPNNTFGIGLVQSTGAAIEAAGGSIVAEVLYTEGQPDYRPDMQSVAQAEPDAIIVAGYGDDSATVFKNARLLGIEAPWYGAYPSILSVEDPEWMSGRLFGVDNGGYGGEVGQSVLAAFEEAHGEAPSPHAYYGYDAVMLLAKAMAAGGTDAAAISAALPATVTDYDGATGTIVWDDRGQRIDAPMDYYAYIDGGLQTIDPAE